MFSTTYAQGQCKDKGIIEEQDIYVTGRGEWEMEHDQVLLNRHTQCRYGYLKYSLILWILLPLGFVWSTGT